MASTYPHRQRSLARSRNVHILIVLAALYVSAMASADFGLTPGDPDPSFGVANGRVVTRFGNTGDEGRKVLIQPDHKIIIVGKGTARNVWGGLSVVRYNPDGILDKTFNSNG